VASIASTIGLVSSVRVGLCQLNPVVGDIEGNTARALEAIRVMEASGADLAVFPELFLTGYPPEDLLLKPSFITAGTQALHSVASASSSCAIVIGFVDQGQDLYNAAAICAGGKVHGIWRKELLPNYGVFDERRWFAPGAGDTPLFLVGGVATGISICEDAWSPHGPMSRQAAGGAELLVSLNASPYRRGVLDVRSRMLATRAEDASCPLVYVNLVGGQDELVFDGASMVFDANGDLLARAAQFEEEIVFCDVPVRAVYRKRILDPRGRSSMPRVPPMAVQMVTEARIFPEGEVHPTASAPNRALRLDPVAEVDAALVLGTRDYVTKNGFRDVVVGLSGGIDSALVAAIAVDALGPERVHAVAMPSRFSSQGSLDDAEALAANLGIDIQVLPIEQPHAAYLELLAPAFGNRPSDLAEENIQARVRGTLLMALSNKLGWLVLTTGNKSEMAVGYATLYGDMAGGFAVIKDVPKTLVYELCEHRNRVAGAAVIPRAILDKAPSAELRSDQRDIDSLPPYDVLDPILEGYVEDDLSLEELVEQGFDPVIVGQVAQLVDRSEYKRRQAPPGVRVTSRAFGKDRRMPLTNAFRPARPS